MADDYPKLTISFLRGDADSPFCTQYPEKLHGQFTAPHPREKDQGLKEVGASILELPATFEGWWDAVGYYTRRKVRRAEREGYRFEEIEPPKYVDDIFAINTSMPERQGKPMKGAYLERPEYEPLPTYTCAVHRQCAYGVLKDDTLVAYSWVYQVGEMCLFSTILGHADHLQNGVMFQLISGALKELIPASGTKYAMYDMHLGGTEGLRFFKEQMGFRPFHVRWILGDEPEPPRGLFSRRSKAPR